MNYTCPMHPEIVRDAPGNCLICGMKLVPVGMSPALSTNDRGLGPLSWKSYLPLVIIVGMILLVALVTASTATRVVEHFMAGFFVVFGTFKLLDLNGFADGYWTYDLIAQRIKAYGYIYPFLEIGFGFAMLAGVRSPVLYLAEFAIMVVSGIGVAIKLSKHEKFQCVCLGTFLKVPLTTVTLVEDFGMAILALMLLLSRV